MSAADALCVQCSTPLRKPAHGPMPRYCSATCRARACDARDPKRKRKWNATKLRRRQAKRLAAWLAAEAAAAAEWARIESEAA